MKKIVTLVNLLSFILLIERSVWACSVCFAGTDQNVIWGVKAAIIILLGALLVIMAALIKFFVSIARRSKPS